MQIVYCKIKCHKKHQDLHNQLVFMHNIIGPGALISMLCLVTCQIGTSRFLPNSHVATSYVPEETNPNIDI